MFDTNACPRPTSSASDTLACFVSAPPVVIIEILYLYVVSLATSSCTRRSCLSIWIRLPPTLCCSSSIDRCWFKAVIKETHEQHSIRWSSIAAVRRASYAIDWLRCHSALWLNPWTALREKLWSSFFSLSSCQIASWAFEAKSCAAPITSFRPFTLYTIKSLV